MAQKILVIDDEVTLAALLKERLAQKGYAVITASNGTEGIRMLSEEHPDLAILDVRMPEMDGYTFVKTVRVNKELNGIPIIVLTAVEGLDDILKLEGVKDYLKKPFDTKVLLEKVARYLGAEQS